jgi:tetratricopeptide (TPR) repeat protein
MTETPHVQPRLDRGPLVGACLVLLVVAVFGRVCGNEFVNYDDPVYVTDNAHVRDGLSLRGLAWAFTATQALNWHPLTWISLQLDAQIHRTAAWGYHLTNLLLHAANTVLLFLALRRLTGALWRPALVAALFGLHPLHVESVAWVAERKDVLSTFFGMLALLAYLGYVRRPAPSRYLLVAALLALGLMSKPMLVTFPFLLLLLDYWPLGRLFASGSAETGAGDPVRVRPAPVGWRLVVLEKVPLLALSGLSAALTLYAQQRGGAIEPLTALPFGDRLANALVSYVRYLGLMLWPIGLAPFYPHPQGPLPVWQVAAAAILLAALSVLALALARRRPYALVGWLWYLGSLVPVIGLVQVGEQALADRYTYVPLIGLFIVLAWGAGDLAGYRPLRRGALSAMAISALLACAVLTWKQVGVWHDSRSLWEHALRVTPDNHVARNNLGFALLQDGQDLAEAEQHLRAAGQLKADFVRPLTNLAIALDQQGKMEEALRCYREALHLEPGLPATRVNYGVALCRVGRVDEGMEQFRQVIERDPDYADAHYHLAYALVRQKKFAEALPYCRECVRLDPRSARYRLNLSFILYKLGDKREAQEHYDRAQQLGARGAALPPSEATLGPRP